jgi:oxygen-dependent protoporphyrinogen oxidase
MSRRVARQSPQPCQPRPGPVACRPEPRVLSLSPTPFVAIVGGGITGLAAACELTARNVPFRLFESSSRLGGLIRTEYAGGFVIEAGPDSILVQKPAALDLCKSLGLESQLISTIPPRTAFVLKHGRLHPLPSPSVLGIPTGWRGIAGYSLLGPAARLRLALEPLVPRRARVDDEAVGPFFRRRFGQATVDLIAEPLLGGIHAGDIESLSMSSLFPRFVDAERRRGSVLRAFRHDTAPASPAGGLFRSLVGGMGDLVQAIAHRLPAASVHLDSPVESIRQEDGRWRIGAGGVTWTADAVVVACPARTAAALLEPLDERAAALCREVPYVSTASIALAWPRAAIRHSLRGSGFVVARQTNALRLTACTWVSSKWSGRAPKDTALLRAFVGGLHDPLAVDLDDDRLVELASRELSGILGIAGTPILSRVYRWRDAGAQHNVGQIARVAAIEQRLARYPGLVVAGSGFRSVGIPDCVADGRAAAGAVAGNG